MTKPNANRLGKYVLFEVIGEGAMGTVYRAQDPVLVRDVAVKLMKKSFATDPHLRDRFEREAKAAAGLQHPNIVTIHDFGEAKGHLYIVMEFVLGTDLATLIRNGTPLSLDTRLGIVTGVLKGLGYAHERGIVHRDVKPANIRVLDDGTVKLMDFGIAHLTGSEITNSGVVLGTPDYMAPEQVEGRPVTPATDIFAVGAVLYELLTHQKPFQGDTLHAVLHNVVTADPAPLQHTNNSVPVPEELQATIRTALAKDVKTRYATTDAMIEALNVARAAFGERDTEETLLLRPAPRRPKSRRRLLIAASTVGLVGAGVAAVSVGSAGRAATRTENHQVAVAETAVVPPSSLMVATRSVSESAFAPLRSAALVLRGRATAAGATRAVLAVGDSLAREADGLAALGRQGEAMENLAAATKQWQAAREQAWKKPIPPVDVRQIAQGAAVHLAQAVAGKDPDAVRRLYPNLASDEHDRFVQFFQSNDSIQASLKVDNLEVQDRRATGIIRGTYDYLQLKDAKRRHDEVEYRAIFERTNSGWRLTMIRGGLFKK